MRVKPAAAPLLVPFREVRHFQPDDCLHYETIDIRGRLHDWTIPAHRHLGLHQIHYLARGAVEAAFDGIRYTLEAPALWMLAPGTVHGFAYARHSAGQQVTVPSGALESALTRSQSMAARLPETIVLSSDELVSGAAECEALFARIADEFAQSRPGRIEALSAWVTLLLLWVLRRSRTVRSTFTHQALRDALTHRFRSMLELHFRRHQPLTFYARSLGVTVDHLTRICRATTGLSSLELLHQRLVLEARRQLAYSTAGVAAIAQDLGFDDPAYFSRFFARSAGQSPSRYRSAVADGRDAPPASSGAGAPT